MAQVRCPYCWEIVDVSLGYVKKLDVHKKDDWFGLSDGEIEWECPYCGKLFHIKTR